MWLVVVNPKAGMGAAASLATQVVGFLKSREIAYRMISPNSATETKLLVRESLRKGEATRLLSVGGDGLFHLLLQFAIEFKVPLAIAPGGTGNDFYRTLGWFDHDLMDYLDHLNSTQPSLVDVGVVDGEYFGAVLSSGFDSVVNERANKMKWPKGPAKYNAAIVLEFPKFKAGDNVTVNYKITEGNKDRIQSFKGDVLKRQGTGHTATFTVRKISDGVGVERLFPFLSPNIDGILLNKSGKVRRAKLYYLRDRSGKSARIKEKRF
jgi:ribosomal protein L19